MAVPAKIPENEKFPMSRAVRPHLREACKVAARLFGLGYDRKVVAKAVVPYLEHLDEWPMHEKVQYARSQLRRWEAKPWFRDMVWDTAVVELDMSTPAILRGVAMRAKRGRVDAAKLALGVTGRYVEKTADVPSAVTINLVGIPRPNPQAVAAQDDQLAIEAGEVVDED
jgi:hypothetical protein